ncbi:MAG TPA: transglutaminaseTgpA domain-containing protein [Acidimicrobiales bacterium]
MSLVGAVKRANAKGTPEESIALRVAVLVAVLAAAGAAVSQGVGGPTLRVAATLGIAFGFAYSHHARYQNGYVLKGFLAAGVLLAFGSFLSQTSGAGAQALNELQVPLAELFLWVQVLHSLDVPARRDLLFSLLSSLVLMAVAAVLSVSSALGPFLLVWAIATLASLVLAHRSELAERPSLDVPLPSAAASTRAAGRKSVRPVVAVVAMALALALAVFLVLPAAGPGRAVAFPSRLANRLPVPEQGGLANPSLGGDDPASRDGQTSSTGTGRASTGYFGFSESLDTGIRGRPDNTLVMRVRAARPDFWRGQTFDTWDGRTWKQSDQRIRSSSGDGAIELIRAAEDRPFASGRELIQTVHVEATGPNLLFAAHSAKKVYFPDRRVFEMSDGTIRTAVHLPDDSVYTVVSERMPAGEDDLRRAGEIGRRGDDAALVERYTTLPPNVPKRVRELADRLAAESPNRYDLVRSIERWMAENTAYTLDIPPLPAGADAVEQFLFEDQQGFCEQIATALVVMLRSQHIPARLAVGYAPGQRNPFTGMWEVRAKDAHAWAEVWFPSVGWQQFDPTASVPLAGDPYSGAAATGLLAYVKAMLPSVPDALRTSARPLVLAGAPLLVGAFFAVRELRRRRREARRAWADVALGRLERMGTKQGRSRRPWETPTGYARTLAVSVLADARVQRVAALVEADAFAPGPPDPDARAEADRLLTELEERVGV